MKFYTYAVVDSKKGKVLVKPNMIFVKDKKTLEYLALKKIPKSYAKKLGDVDILIRDDFPTYDVKSLTGEVAWTNYPITTFTSNGTGIVGSSYTTNATAIK